jgi:hypothetical protein
MKSAERETRELHVHGLAGSHGLSLRVRAKCWRERTMRFIKEACLLRASPRRGLERQLSFMPNNDRAVLESRSISSTGRPGVANWDLPRQFRAPSRIRVLTSLRSFFVAQSIVINLLQLRIVLNKA